MLLFVVIAWLVVWVWRAYLASSRSLPLLGLALALSMFALGAVVGVLLQVGFAAGTAIVPGRRDRGACGRDDVRLSRARRDAIQEWRVKRTTGMPRGGLVQLGALFAGGLILVAALLTGAAQVGGLLYLLAELIAVVLFIVRILPTSLRTSWAAASAERHLAVASIWIVVSLGIFMYLVSQFIAANGDQSAIPIGILIASDHATYIGVITNTSFAILTALLGAAAGNVVLRQLVFWGMNPGWRCSSSG